MSTQARWRRGEAEESMQDRCLSFFFSLDTKIRATQDVLLVGGCSRLVRKENGEPFSLARVCHAKERYRVVRERKTENKEIKSH